MRSTRNGQGWVLGWPRPSALRILAPGGKADCPRSRGTFPQISGGKESTLHPALLPALSTHTCEHPHVYAHTYTYKHTHANDRCCSTLTWTAGRSHRWPHGACGRRPSSEQEHHLAESGEQPPPHPTSHHCPGSRPPWWLQSSGSS